MRVGLLYKSSVLYFFLSVETINLPQQHSKLHQGEEREPVLFERQPSMPRDFDADDPEPSLMELMDRDRRLALPEGYGTELGDLMASNNPSGEALVEDDPMATDQPTTTTMPTIDPKTSTQRDTATLHAGKPPSVPDFIAKLFRYVSLLLCLGDKD